MLENKDIVTATALIQALQRLGFEFPAGNGVIKKCGVDFLKMEVPEVARVKKLSIRYRTLFPYKPGSRPSFLMHSQRSRIQKLGLFRGPQKILRASEAGKKK